MTPVWLMSALDIHSEMQHAAKPKEKDIEVRVLAVDCLEDEDSSLPLWAHHLLEHFWLEED